MVKLKQNKYAIHSVELPVSKKKVEFRPWNIGEQEVLTMAYSGKDKREIRRAVRQIVNQCIQGNVHVPELPMADMELLFLRIRSKSVGEVAKVILDNEITKESKEIPVDLTTVQVLIPPNRNTKIELVDTDGGDTGMFFVMKEPTVAIFEEVIALKEKDPKISEELEIAIRSVDKVCDSTDQSEGADQRDEIREYIRTMTPKQYEPLEEFLNGIPVIHHEVELSQVFPNMNGKYVLEGLDSFFG